MPVNPVNYNAMRVQKISPVDSFLAGIQPAMQIKAQLAQRAAMKRQQEQQNQLFEQQKEAAANASRRQSEYQRAVQAGLGGGSNQDEEDEGGFFSGVADFFGFGDDSEDSSDDDGFLSGISDFFGFGSKSGGSPKAQANAGGVQAKSALSESGMMEDFGPVAMPPAARQSAASRSAPAQSGSSFDPPMQRAPQQRRAPIIQDPNYWIRLRAQYPEFAAETKAIYDATDKAKRDDDFAFNGRLSAAIESGQMDIAKRITMQRREAFRDDPDELAELDDALMMLDKNPAALANFINMEMSNADVEKFKSMQEARGKYGVEKRASEMQPSALRKSEFDADAAGSAATSAAAKAGTAFESESAALRSAQAAAVSAQAKADNAPVSERAAADKAVADADKAFLDVEESKVKVKYAEKNALAALGLTNAQINKTMVETKKLNAETQQVINAAAAGGLTPGKRFEAEEGLRKEYETRSKGYNDVAQQYAAIEASAADGSGAGDIALVTAFNKMLDPGSVVRETEFANSRDTAGLVSKLRSYGKKLDNGEFLSTDQRASFRRLAGDYYRAAEEKQKRDRNTIDTVATSYKLDKANIFGTMAVPKAPEKPKPVVNIDSFFLRP